LISINTVTNCSMFERNQKMTKRLVVAGLLVGTVLFALAGCDTQSKVEENQIAVDTNATRQTQEVSKVEEVEEAEEAEEAKDEDEDKEDAEEEDDDEKVAGVVEKIGEVKPAESTKLTLRINCGATEPYTDKAGNTWLADQSMEPGGKWGAVDGLTVDRGDLGIEGTDVPKIYQTERYSMEGYKFTVPNGKYTVRLHFAETYDGITAAGERVFSVTINDQTVLKDFDPFKEAGGYQKPAVKTIEDVLVTNGELAIGFTVNIQNPEINGIEILSK